MNYNLFNLYPKPKRDKTTQKKELKEFVKRGKKEKQYKKISLANLKTTNRMFSFIPKYNNKKTFCEKFSRKIIFTEQVNNKYAYNLYMYL